MDKLRLQPAAHMAAAAAPAVPTAISGPDAIATGPRGNLGFSDPQEVHVWAFDLNVSTCELERLKSVLSPHEVERSARFHFDRHRNHYIAAHGGLREVIARYLSLAPNNLEFDHGPRGKPFLAGSVNSSGLQFNLAHSEAFALLAISPQARVGVDVEHVRTLPDAEELVARFFSSREASQFRALSHHQRDEAFFNLWTRKEAWLKATGEGIGHLLAEVEVSFLPAAPARLLSLPNGYNEGLKWSLISIAPAKGFVGAVAVETGEAKPSFHAWNFASKEGLL